MRQVGILGSTGSIGTQALDVVRRSPDRFRVVALSAAGMNQELFVGQIREFLPPHVAIADEAAAHDIQEHLGPLKGVQFIVGPNAAEQLASETEADLILNALVGSAGLPPTLAALQAGKTLALANKESLVVGGELVMDLVKGEPERLLPVDSEHAALAMAIRHERREDLKRVVITGSGGPFRGWTHSELQRASVKEALQHPVWSMGPKITIDSATLMNKGLELIEAHLLFDVPVEDIAVVVHPQSVVHSMVEFVDGSTIAQASPPDMRLPIALGLSWPDRLDDVARPCDWSTATSWTFEPLDEAAFPAVRLAKHVGRAGGTYPAVFNAANEQAVEAFHAGRIGYLAIVATIEQVVDAHTPHEMTLDGVLEAERWARAAADAILAG